MNLVFVRKLSLLLLAAAGFASAARGFSQDTRVVAEPRVPHSCIQLSARLSLQGGALSVAEESMQDTVRIQQALDRCDKGSAVELRSSGASHVFLSSPLQLRPGTTLLVDAGTALVASRNPRDYDLSPGSCGVVDDRGHGCKPLLLAEEAPGAGLMGDGVIDGRGGAMLLGQKQTWWDLAHLAKVRDQQQSCPRLLVVRRSDNFTMYHTMLRNAPNFHVVVEQTNGFTAWGVRIDTPATARNTDGIDPSSSTNVTITRSYIRAGDDNIAIKAGKLGAATHMTITDNHFYSGHGMSIGSETNGGVSDILVRNLTIDGADNGIRIKSDVSRGGVVEDITYEKVCMRNVKNPIVMTPRYSNKSGSLLPEYRDILLRDIHVLTPGTFTLQGLDARHPIALIFDNVFADERNASKVDAQFVHVALGPRLGNLVPTGEGVTVSDSAAGKASQQIACQGVFPEFPDRQDASPSTNAVPSIDSNLYVSSDGSGEYHSIQAAVDAAPASGATILIGPGTYRETIAVNKPNLRLVGTAPSAANTVIIFDKSAGSSGGTLHSATVEIRGENFFADNLTFANDWNRTHTQAVQGSQALALLVTGDKAIFHNVRFLGNQDTLYAGSRNCAPDGDNCIPARQYFSDCYIEGNVDFIFGDAKAYFRNCEIRSTPHEGGYITAQAKHYPAENSAFVLDHCRLTASPGAENVWLGRPWRPYSTVVYLHTWMEDHIVPAGWREWHPGETHSLDTAWYAEFDSSGPGAHPQERDSHTHALTAAEAERFSLNNFFPGWDAAAELQSRVRSFVSSQ